MRKQIHTSIRVMFAGLLASADDRAILHPAFFAILEAEAMSFGYRIHITRGISVEDAELRFEGNT